MPAPYTVTAPLALRLADGTQKVIAACFPHPLGVLYLDTFWHLRTPQASAHLLQGELQGEGPWKIGGNVLRVLGCHGTDPELQPDYTAWRDYLAQNPTRYPPPEQIRDIVRKLGALV